MRSNHRVNNFSNKKITQKRSCSNMKHLSFLTKSFFKDRIVIVHCEDVDEAIILHVNTK